MQDILSALGNIGTEGGITENMLITTMAVMLLLAGICAVIFHKIRLPPIVGYLIAGIIIVNVFSDEDFTKIFSVETIGVLKNIGLIMLMFGIGTELNFNKVKKAGKFAILVAVIQLPLMVLSGCILGAMIFNLNPTAAITLGAVISGSSTAVVAAVLKSQKRISQEDYDTLILVTIMEDIGQVIILSMITPLFAGAQSDAYELIALIIKIILFMVISIVLGLKVVPRILNWIGDKTNSEILLVLSIGLCFGMAWLSSSIGMSTAIGAFLMGMIVSQSKYAPDIEKKTDPMKAVFMAVFFISIGMEVGINEFIDSLPMAIGIAAIFMISKLVTVFIGYFVGGKRFGISFISSISLMAMGEFAFIISSQAHNSGVVSDNFYFAVIGAAIITMILMPIFANKSFDIADKVEENKNSDSFIYRVGRRIYGIREDVATKIETSPSVGDVVKKNLKKSYFCLLLIVVIQIIFSCASYDITKFFVKLVEQFVEFDNIEFVVNICVMTVNFILLTIPTSYFIISLKGIGRIMTEELEPNATEGEKRKRAIKLRILGVSTFAFVVAIDFIIMAVTPGPFGGKGTLIVIPIAIIILLLGWFLSGLKTKKETE